MAGLAKTGGGLLLALGLAAPVAAALIFSVMIVDWSEPLPRNSDLGSGGLGDLEA
jgi:hypothetical protein